VVEPESFTWLKNPVSLNFALNWPTSFNTLTPERWKILLLSPAARWQFQFAFCARHFNTNARPHNGNLCRHIVFQGHAHYTPPASLLFLLFLLLARETGVGQVEEDGISISRYRTDFHCIARGIFTFIRSLWPIKACVLYLWTHNYQSTFIRFDSNRSLDEISWTNKYIYKFFLIGLKLNNIHKNLM